MALILLTVSRSKLCPIDGYNNAFFTIVMGNLGRCLVEIGDCRRALGILEQSLRIRRQCLPEDHIDIATGKVQGDTGGSYICRTCCAEAPFL